MPGKTVVSIEGDAFHINGQPTYKGRSYRGWKIEGLLLNARLVQAIFDDLNPETRDMWRYPDGGAWDPDRNTDEFVRMMPTWREHGLIGICFNLQGGSPRGYSKEQPWHNSTFEADGTMRPAYLDRLTRVLDAADELGMVIMLGYFYFGQDQRLADEQAVCRACDNATDWLLERGYTNVIIEIANEINVPKYVQEIIMPPRGHELMNRVRQRSSGRVANPAGRLLVSNSFCGNVVPTDNVIEASDFVLLHGNGVADPNRKGEHGSGHGYPPRIRELVQQVRQSPAYRQQPIAFNEDDHFDFDEPDNNMLAAISEYAGWGYFDWRRGGEGFDEGYQSVPVNWGISSDRKRGFFNLLKEVTGE